MICGCRTTCHSFKQLTSFLSISNVNTRDYSSVAATAPVNHYKTLGLNSKATQTEIKSAYYKLSKIFHPDISGHTNEEAAIKFRQITAAYEVLGNVKLRKMYDRGLLPRESTFYPETSDEFEEKKPSSPYKRTRSQPMTGRSEHYNFDEWSRLHYGYAMNRTQNAKAKQEARKMAKLDTAADVQTDQLLALVAVGLVTLFVFNYIGTNDYDKPVKK